MNSSLRALFAAALTLAASFTLAQAQQTIREVETTENADYFGFDLRAERNVDLDRCKQICIEDNACKAFTYNTKAKWCFLKSDFREVGKFDGAIAGKIVERLNEPDIGAAPKLTTVSSGVLEEARVFRRRAVSVGGGDENPVERQSALLVAMAQRDSNAAETAAWSYLGGDPENLGNWNEFVRLALEFGRSDAANNWRMRDLAVAGAVNAYNLTRTRTARAEALAKLAETLEARSDYRAAIDTYKASLELANSPQVAEVYKKLRSEKGFRITGNSVDADNATPRACVDFSEELLESGVDYSTFVTLDGKAGPPVSAEGSQLCVEGLEHGKSYQIAIRAGLPSTVDEALEEPSVYTAYIRDRAPAVRFTGENFVLPGFARQGIPIVGINADVAELELYRIGDRSIARLLSGSRFLQQLEGYNVEELRDDMGSPVWSGKIDLARELNREIVTSLPLDEVLPKREPGVYLLTAVVHGQKSEYWDPRATQWFVVSDIGLTTYTGNDGLTVMARSLDTATAIAGAELTLLARNNEVLGTATTDANGVARFAAGLTLGTGSMAPVAVTARHNGAKGADYVFLDLDRAGFDLSDRGVTGREAPGPVDVFTWLDRGIYRPGETVHGMALARDDSASAVDGLPLTIIYQRPDGVEAARIVSGTPKAGGHHAEFAVPASAMRGVWKMLVHTDPDSDPVAEKLFLVEDFQPDRIEFDMKPQSAAISPDEPAKIDIDGRFLYGAPANDMALEGEVRIRTAREIAAVPGYRFGLDEEEDSGAEVERLEDLPRTGADGKALIEVPLGATPASTRPLTAEITVRMREDGGRAVERKVSLPVQPESAMIGIRPEFDGGVQENATASFRIVAIDAAAQRIDLAGLGWKLYRIERDYQWYRDGSYWRYEAVTRPRLETEGTVDAKAAEAVQVSVPVKWGEYRLEVASAEADGPATSVVFEAGYYVEQESAETPDALQIALDKPTYAAGETAKLRIESRFAGELVAAIGSDRVFETVSVAVPEGGATVDIPVKAEWGAGAYVTATLFRPGGAQESRMPMRAVGTAWLAVDPGERKIAVSLELPERAKPRESLAIPVSLTGVPAGEKAYVTVAAVDVGILNLTRYTPPSASGWYYGQRKLGLEMRDLYGKLIDGSLGAFGKIRTGGDGPGLAPEGSPPTEKLLALFSGVVEVDAQGKAVVEFELPEFNGTARVMAVAWSGKAVGEANGDVIIRDPVVLTASLPKTMAPGDEAQTVIEIANTDGPAGAYDLAIATSGGVEVTGAPAKVELAAGERKAIEIGLAARETGTAQVTVTVANGAEAYASRTQLVNVRPSTLPVATLIEVPLAANGTVTIDKELLAQFHTEGASVSVGVSRTPGFDVAALLTKLDRYPYGCAEQTTSRALPLLYLSDLDAPKELLETPDLAKRVDGAIERVLSYQSSSGAFGLWGPGDGDMWLDAYVTDFLTRAREKGYTVPEQAMRLAVTNLQNKLGWNDDVSENGNAIAYALYVLARNRMASAADLRYYADVRIGEFDSALARAHLAAALGLYNEVERSSRAYGSALELASGADYGDTAGVYDYGSKLRDGAAILALAAETRPEPATVPEMMELVVQELGSRKYTSTQEQAWMLLAARAAQEMNAALELTLNGTARTGALSMTMSGEAVSAQPVTIGNPGAEALTVNVTAVASPIEPLAAGGTGFTIEREYFTLDGEPAEVKEVRQNERYVVVLTVTEEGEGESRLLVTDLLPGGFEIDNPRLVQSAELEAFDWLGETEVAHSEFRNDRFVAALNRGGDSEDTFTVAYVVRAVTPGKFVHPAASVEDMYRPELSARTATGFMQVLKAE